jgi:hypothetical protein
MGMRVRCYPGAYLGTKERDPSPHPLVHLRAMPKGTEDESSSMDGLSADVIELRPNPRLTCLSRKGPSGEPNA